VSGNALLLLPPAAVAAAAAVAGLLCALPAARLPSARRQGWLLALGPATAFALLVVDRLEVGQGQATTWSVPWLAHAGLTLGLHLDGLAALFGLLVSGIGALVVVYAGYYLADAREAAAFQLRLLLFGLAMLGLVMAGDTLTLFVFWEGTSVTSFLLIGFRRDDPASRKAATQSLLVTGGGGIALLLGLVLLAERAGGTQWASIMAAGDALRADPLYLVILAFLLLAAMTKSAQAPFHFWLPAAMAAPTPASAYLHSATMVKAGVYLMARMHPALGGTAPWFWALTLVGGVTMLAGAYVGLRQRDIKALLAYATVSQLGAFMLLLGQETHLAFKALVVGVLAHALYKSALFMVAGVVDHEAHTRDLDRLGGLGRAMPRTFAAAAVAALSMAGLPPLFGFLAKETLLATAVVEGLPPLMGVLLPAAALLAGGLMLALAATLMWETFLGPRLSAARVHDPPLGMLVAPAVPALASLGIGLLPEPAGLARLLADAAADAYGHPVKVSLALWTGLNVPLLLSAVAIAFGSGVFVTRARVRAWQARLSAGRPSESAYDAALDGLLRAGLRAAALQTGRLRAYLVVVMGGTLALSVVMGHPWVPPGLERALDTPTRDLAGTVTLLRLFTLIVAVVGAASSVLLRRDLAAILALNASGLAVGTLMILEPAPDVALVQFVVDLLATVILVLALVRLPRAERRRASRGTWLRDARASWQYAAVAAGGGLLVAWATLVALTTRPRPSMVTPMYALTAKPLTGARDVVGAIVVDFRALDTMLEITVFALAGLGAYRLLARLTPVGPAPRPVARRPLTALGASAPTLGIAGKETSPFVHALAYAAMPIALVVAAVQVLYGHDRPGDGFTAGVLVSLVLGFWYVVFGYSVTHAQLPWLRPTLLTGVGLLLAVGAGLTGYAFDGSFLGPVDLGLRWGLPSPPGVHWSTSLAFEAAICLVVIGGASSMLDSLGRGNGDRQGGSAAAGEGREEKA